MENPLQIELLTKTFDDLSIGVGIFEVVDLNDLKSIHYVFMNKVLLYEMRKEREEVVGKRIIDVAPEAYEHEGGMYVINTYRNVARDGGSVNLGIVEYSNHMVAGLYECSVHHIMGNFVYVMLRNVTELERTKHELEQKNKELTQFVYTASHDLKEPLNTISSSIQFIQEDYAGKFDNQADELFEFMLGSTNRMRSLITDLLNYSTVGRGNKEEVDCQLTVKVVLQDLKTKLEESEARVTTGELPRIKGYPTDIRSLFQNLISNSIKFCKPGVAPQISITAKEEDESWIFAIQDNGIGISGEHQKSVFNLFERLNSNSKYTGTGIGLAHCKKIIDLHEGTIWIESEPGEGSTFFFKIPK